MDMTSQKHKKKMFISPVASPYNSPTVKHRDIPAFAKHLIAVEIEAAGDCEKGGDNVDEVWYSDYTQCMALTGHKNE